MNSLEQFSWIVVIVELLLITIIVLCIVHNTKCANTAQCIRDIQDYIEGIDVDSEEYYWMTYWDENIPDNVD